MDAGNAFEAIEAVRASVPEGERAELDMQLVSRFGLASVTAGIVATEGVAEVITDSASATEVSSPTAPRSFQQKIGSGLGRVYDRSVDHLIGYLDYTSANAPGPIRSLLTRLKEGWTLPG